GAVFENASGGGKNNTLTGNALKNTLTARGVNNNLAGGSGDDVYVIDLDIVTGTISITESGIGTDTLDYSTTTTVAVKVNLSVIDPGNTIENVIGGDGNDTLTGNGLGNLLKGGAG